LWSKLANKNKSIVKIAAADCEIKKEICSEFKVDRTVLQAREVVYGFPSDKGLKSMKVYKDDYS